METTLTVDMGELGDQPCEFDFDVDPIYGDVKINSVTWMGIDIKEHLELEEYEKICYKEYMNWCKDPY